MLTNAFASGTIPSRADSMSLWRFLSKWWQSAHNIFRHLHRHSWTLCFPKSHEIFSRQANSRLNSNSLCVWHPRWPAASRDAASRSSSPATNPHYACHPRLPRFFQKTSVFKKHGVRGQANKYYRKSAILHQQSKAGVSNHLSNEQSCRVWSNQQIIRNIGSDSP